MMVLMLMMNMMLHEGHQEYQDDVVDDGLDDCLEGNVCSNDHERNSALLSSQVFLGSWGPFSSGNL